MQTHRVIRHTALLVMVGALIAFVLPLMASADDAVTPQPPMLPHEQSGFDPSTEQNKATVEEAPLLSAAGQGELVAGQYIVVLKESDSFSPTVAQDKVDSVGGKLEYTYSAALQGFSAELSAEAVETLRADPMLPLLSKTKS